MNRERRKTIRHIEQECEQVRIQVAITHEEEYQYREVLWHKGLDESDVADSSDDALDHLNKAETCLRAAIMELQRARK